MEALCDAMGTLCARARAFFQKIAREYERQRLRARAGDEWAYLMYGDPGAFYLDGSQLMMDIRGLVFEPVEPRSKACPRS